MLKKTSLTTLLLIFCSIPQANLAASDEHIKNNKHEKDVPFQYNTWVDLFNGQNLDGWKSNEHEASFKVENGAIVASGEISHLYYLGENGNASFKNFELIAEIMTTPLANSGIYFHTSWQDKGWPVTGYEAQINASHIGGGGYRELKKSGSLYGVKNVHKSFAKDNEWHTMHIRVEAKNIQIRINNKLLVNYTEPEQPIRKDFAQRVLNEGTFALQCHDPDSKVYFRSIKVRELPENKNISQPKQEVFADIMALQTSHLPFVDLNIKLNNTASFQQHFDTYYQSGVNLGFLVEPKDASLLFKKQLANYPIFRGLKLESSHKIPKANMLNKFDYVLGHVEYDESEGAAKHLKKLAAFVENYPINILSAKSLNVKNIDDQNIETIIKSAIKNNIVFEISAIDQLPSPQIIRSIKKFGGRFATGNLIQDNQVNIDYFLSSMESANLSYKDFYIPGEKL